MDGPRGSGEVIRISGRAQIRPDYKRLASAQVLAAMQRTGQDQDGFAAYLAEMLGWHVNPEAVGRWAHGAPPPGDVLLACAVIVKGTAADVLAFPLTATAESAAALLSRVGLAEEDAPLESVPNGFSADALAGTWVTSYQFTHAGRPRHHADIAHVAAVSVRVIRAVNHPPAPRTEGRALPFLNVIEAELAGRHVIGQWRNTSDTRYFGALQLAVMPGETVMDGWYAGVGSDVEVSSGRWRWVRLASESPEDLILSDPATVYELVMNYSQYDVPLSLADIGEET